MGQHPVQAGNYRKERVVERAIGAFIDDVRTILTKGEPTDQVFGLLVARMRELVREPEVLATHRQFMETIDPDHNGADLHADTGRRSQVVYTDDTGLTLVRSRFDPEEATPIHSHSTWGVVGVYAGRDWHQAWRRKDDGAGAGHAVIELIEERILEPGDVVVIPDPPQDIHRQQGYGGEPAYEFILFGANAMVIPRLIFDVDNEGAREVIPGQQ